ncbi:glycosyltransferase family 39 protein [Patescibacteria group bacterium]
MNLSNFATNTIAALFLAFMLIICIFSLAGDSATMDEVAHLPSGYSYVTQNDMRLNPEHPPLVKDFAGAPLLLLDGINFPSNIDAWKTDINGQWAFGYSFLYEMGNPADQMIFWGRIPMVLLLIFLGFLIFRWARERYGNKVALLSLFFFAFSPTFLAHGRLVTTDVAAALGAVLASYYFLKFLKYPTEKNIIFAGLAFGIAQLLKFSLFLLYPFFGLILLLWVIFKVDRGKIREFIAYGIKFVLVLAVGFLLIWPVYYFHTANLPTEKIELYSQELLKTNPLQKVIDPPKVISTMANNEILKPWSYYLLGVFMVTERAAGGHTTYFLGEVSASGWVEYFPIVYALKESLAFHILTIITLLFWAYSIKEPFWYKGFSRFKNWAKNNFTALFMVLWIILYWLFSLGSNLNIGVRHLLPTFPFVYILVSVGIVKLLSSSKNPVYSMAKYGVLALFILWQAVSVILVYPSFLSYFNEIAGGPDKGYRYTVDSNLDWGQDLKRLKTWTDENNVDKIYVDYFGGGRVEYYLEDKFMPWWGNRDPKDIEKGSYLAISATLLQGGRGEPATGFTDGFGHYRWLYSYEPPVEKIGNSIFIYQIK